MKSTSPKIASGLTLGAPLTLTTSAQTIDASSRIADIILTLVNYTGTSATVTLNIVGTTLVITVPANSVVPIGPFSYSGTITALASALTSIKVLASVRVADII